MKIDFTEEELLLLIGAITMASFITSPTGQPGPAVADLRAKLSAAYDSFEEEVK